METELDLTVINVAGVEILLKEHIAVHNVDMTYIKHAQKEIWVKGL